MADWQLGIDFGTSFTVVAVARGDRVEVVDVESDGRSRSPSSVLLTADGDILVGTQAQHQAVFHPERYEPTPKRSIGEGEIFLGDRLIPVSTLVAGVLRRVYREACRQQGETVPVAIRVTHPADWAETRLNVLRVAIEAAGLHHVTLVAEPVAAAARIAMESTTPGQHIAVYDFGGGTFDAAVLRRTDRGFEVAGQPMGRDPLGGEDIDQRIIDHLGTLLSDQHPTEWKNLVTPSDIAWRRASVQLRLEVQRAKETLSGTNACQLWVAGIEREVQLTRTELEDLIRPDIEATVETLEHTITAAGLTVADLQGIYMVGGSSRIPLVADTIWRRFEVRPMTATENPKSVVAMGAAVWDVAVDIDGQPAAGDSASAAVAPGFAPAVGPEGTPPNTIAVPQVAAATPPVVPDAPPTAFRARLAMSADPTLWPPGVACSSTLVVEQGSLAGARVELRDEPASVLDSSALAFQVGEARGRTTPGYRHLSMQQGTVLGIGPGSERRFVMQSNRGPLEMLERYLVVQGRALVITASENARAVADGIKLHERTIPGPYHESLGIAAVPVHWRARERMTLNRNRTEHRIAAEHELLPFGLPPEQWVEREVAAAVARSMGGTMLSRGPARILGSLSGEVVTIRSIQRKIPVLTKVGLAVTDGHVYEMTITLPEQEQAVFPSLARHAGIQPQ